MTDDSYVQISEHYEKCLEMHDASSSKAVDWPNQADLNKRFRVMTDIVRASSEKKTLLDFGCGTALLLDWLREIGRIQQIAYTGCDLSEKFISYCKTKDYSKEHESGAPGLKVNFFQVDAIKAPEQLPSFDYIVMNGVLTMKMGLSFEEMWDFTQKLLTNVFQKANVGVAFNVMSKQVDWERDDLFHLPLDLLANFVTKKLTRNFVVRNDYGLYEYTVYLYKEPVIK